MSKKLGLAQQTIGSYELSHALLEIHKCIKIIEANAELITLADTKVINDLILALELIDNK